MSIQGTYKHYIDLQLGGEHVSYDIEIDYDYHPGIYDPDPCYDLSEALTINCMAMTVDDRGMISIIPDDYHQGIINQLNPAFENHLNKQWQEHVIDQAGEKAIDREESLSMAVGL